MDILPLLSNYAGLISLGVTIVGAFFVIKSGRLQSANTAQSSAIGALQAEMEVKDKEVMRLTRTVERLELTIDTMCATLKKKGFDISIQGELINIEDKRGNSTTTRIRPVRLTQDDAI